ncbi:hypothetical protein CLV58_13533 [Spirosoma oryzae]|uniref:HTH cro/C1-type domain-containing protein n=1 Tax=Spirosoma oryzae TaxID=1469603 RepID=A0A2T0S0S0_9BACT|nr:hypothetical protein [Spirosoma oryzae]PRY27031.1 hypothetical protein CLV58_13533 [Spirosoma oryzae]
MNEISQLIVSHLNAREAVLRVVKQKQLRASDLVEDMQLSLNILRRKIKTADWRADELSQLARLFGMTVNLEVPLRLLNEQLQTLSEHDWKRLVRETHIGKQRIQSLMNDCCLWRDTELYQVNNFMQKYARTPGRSF